MDTSSEDDENHVQNSSKNSLLLPEINDKNFAHNADFKESFLRLTSMVRRVYFSYLYKSLLSNYAISCTTKNVEDFGCRIKNCASQMELFAVRSALETSLYRKAMLKLISEVKEHTNEQKLYKSLISFLITSPKKSDVAIQTDETLNLRTKVPDTSQPKDKNMLTTESVNDLSNYTDPTFIIKSEPLGDDFNVTPVSQSNAIIKNEVSTEIEQIPDLKNTSAILSSGLNVSPQKSTLIDTRQNFNPDTNLQNVLNESVASKAEDSQDSLFQTMEDMFCESDDSSDLTTLIEKHSSTQMESSISQLTPEIDLEHSKIDTQNKLGSQISKRKRTLNTNINTVVKKRNVKGSPIGFNELKSSKYRKKVNEIWLVERVHQTSKLKSTMLEISILNYRKYGRIKNKFVELFGESDDEDVMPESPVCIEEHLQACKERIAPWIVKHLTPFYNQKRISSRELFKTICRHITDMLIINDTFPDETSVENYIRDFFKNKRSVNTEAEIYL